jgi:hypothetical protein
MQESDVDCGGDYDPEESRDTGEYPIGGPVQYQYEQVTGRYAVGELTSLLAKMNAEVPEESMGDECPYTEELNSGDISVISAEEVAALIDTDPELG